MKLFYPIKYEPTEKKVLFHNELCYSGMDLLKHGESAYPADAWVEQQYMKEEQYRDNAVTAAVCLP